jgi:outer membrane autotransporter protein
MESINATAVACRRKASRRRRIALRRLACAIALGLAGASPVQAATVYDSIWTGANSGQWDDAGNWVVPPVAGSYVLIDTLAPHAATLDDSASVGMLVVGLDGAGRLTIGPGGSLAVTGGEMPPGPFGSAPMGLVIGRGTAGGSSVTVSGAGARLSVDGQTLVGSAASGALNVTDGGVAELGLGMDGTETFVGFGYYLYSDGGLDMHNGTGAVTVDGPGSVLRYSGGFNAFNGTVDVTNGGTLESVARGDDATSGWGDAVGYGLPDNASGTYGVADGHMTVTIDGAGSSWTSGHYLSVGVGGEGLLRVTNGAAASFAGAVYAGQGSQLYEGGTPTGLYRAGDGSILVSGAGSTFDIVPGSSGAGDLVLGGGGTGTVTVQDGGGMTIAGTAAVGGDHAGTLAVRSGGSIDIDGMDSQTFVGLVVAGDAASTGAVTVDGAGSRLRVAAAAEIGAYGAGSLSVTNGGWAGLALDAPYSEVVLGFGYYGSDPAAIDGVGALTVDGAGSNLDYAGGINLTNGTLAVSGGGLLQGLHRDSDNLQWVDVVGERLQPDADSGFAGMAGTAEAVVTGAGSAWNSVNSLAVGSGSNATLSVLDGGVASFAGFVHIGDLDSRPSPFSASGAILVSGSGSRLAVSPFSVGVEGNAGDILIGQRSAGTLTIADGGRVAADGTIEVAGHGTLLVGTSAGDTASASGDVLVDAGGVLSGHGTIVGDVSVVSGGILSPGSGIGTLTVDGDLALAEGSVLDFEFGAPGPDASTAGASDSVHVSGDLSLDGATLDVADTGNMGPGLYTLFSWGGTLTQSNGGLVFGNLPDGQLLELQYLSDRINLLDTSVDYVFWNANGQATSTQAGGGSGTWSVVAPNWTDMLASGNKAMSPQPGFAIFGGQAGTVTVDDSAGAVTALGMQFASDGYSLAGDTLTLVADADGNAPVIRVGDGSSAGLQMAATIDNTIAGSAGLVKSDAGSLFLYGDNTYTGGTTILGGVLGIRSDANLGAAGEGVTLDGGVLAANGTPVLTRNFTIGEHGGELHFGMDIHGGIHGPGALRKGGDGTLTLRSAGNGVGMLDVAGGKFQLVPETDVGASLSVGADPQTLMGLLVGVTPESGVVDAAVEVGQGATLTVGGGAEIGGVHDGYLDVTDGGFVMVGRNTPYAETILGFGYYGTDASERGRGFLTVDGAGSEYAYAGGINLLNGGITVSDGGLLNGIDRAVSDGAFWVDTIGEHSAAGIAGNASVRIADGGTWNSVNALQVGVASQAKFVVADGGAASFTGFAHIGELPQQVSAFAAPDQVHVHGAGSQLAINPAGSGSAGGNGNIVIGKDGSLIVYDHGRVSAPGGIEVGGNGVLWVGAVDGNGQPVAGGVIDAPSLFLNGPDAWLAFVVSDDLYLFQTPVSGDGGIYVNSGYVRFTGDSSDFTGQVSVEENATLSVNGVLYGDLIVQRHGLLNGTGTVGNVTVKDGGALAPGNSPGTLHVDGDLAMETGSTYAAEIDTSTGVSDSVMVSGNVVIDPGTTLSVTNLAGDPLLPGTSLQLIQTTGTDSTVQGQFDTVTGGSEFLDLDLTYEGGGIVVAVDRSPATTFTSASGGNFGTLGATLDALPDDNALTRLVYTQITSVAQARQVFSDMAGPLHADLRRALLQETRHSRTAIESRFRADATGGEAWIRATGGSANAEAANGLAAADVDFNGAMAGYDTAIGGSRFGVAVGMDSGSYAVDGRATTARLHERQLAVYGATPVGGFRLGYGVAFGWGDAKSERNFDIGSDHEHLRARRDTDSRQLFAEAAWRMGGADRYLEPFLSVASVRAHDDGATEQGGLAALVVAPGDSDAVFSTLGARWAVGSPRAQFTGSVGWQHVAGFDHATASQSFVAGGPAFTMDSLPVKRNGARVDLGGRFRLSPRASLWAGYDGLVSEGSDEHGFQVQLSVGF